MKFHLNNKEHRDEKLLEISAQLDAVTAEFHGHNGAAKAETKETLMHYYANLKVQEKALHVLDDDLSKSDELNAKYHYHEANVQLKMDDKKNLEKELNAASSALSKEAIKNQLSYVNADIKYSTQQAKENVELLGLIHDVSDIVDEPNQKEEVVVKETSVENIAVETTAVEDTVVEKETPRFTVKCIDGVYYAMDENVPEGQMELSAYYAYYEEQNALQVAQEQEVLGDDEAPSVEDMAEFLAEQNHEGESSHPRVRERVIELGQSQQKQEQHVCVTEPVIKPAVEPAITRSRSGLSLGR